MPSNRAVHRSVDSLCRHAAGAVRSLGIQLGMTAGPGPRRRSLPAVMPSTGCVRKKPRRPFSVHMGRRVIHIRRVTSNVGSGAGVPRAAALRRQLRRPGRLRHGRGPAGPGGRPGQSGKQPAIMTTAALGSGHVFDNGPAAGHDRNGDRRARRGSPGRGSPPPAGPGHAGHDGGARSGNLGDGCRARPGPGPAAGSVHRPGARRHTTDRRVPLPGHAAISHADENRCGPVRSRRRPPRGWRSPRGAGGP